MDSALATVGGGASAAVSVSSKGLNHRFEATFQAVDVSAFPELRFWIRADRRGTGSPGCPFYWRLGFESAALSFDSAANTWRRLVPIHQTNVWESVRFSLFDLPSPVRTALSGMRLECIDASFPFRCNLADLRAVRQELIRDAEAALTASLDGKVSFSGNAVPAVVVNADGPAPPAPPCLLIRPYDIQRASERDAGVAMPGEYTETGMHFWPAATPYYLFYDIEARGLDGGQRARLTEFVLDRFSPSGLLLINGAPASAEIVPAPPVEPRRVELVGRTPLRLRVLSAQQKPPESEASVRPYKEVVVDVGYGGR